MKLCLKKATNIDLNGIDIKIKQHEIENAFEDPDTAITKVSHLAPRKWFQCNCVGKYPLVFRMEGFKSKTMRIRVATLASRTMDRWGK